jgi:hypothetical protein
MTPANIAATNTAMGNYFSINDILYTHPMNPLTPGAGTGATQDMRNYGMVLAAMSQYAQTIGMPISSGMVTVMKSLMIVLMVVFVFSISAFAQMGTGQGGGMMGGGWGWGMGYGWGFGIIIAILVIFGIVYMMKRK